MAKCFVTSLPISCRGHNRVKKVDTINIKHGSYARHNGPVLQVLAGQLVPSYADSLIQYV